MPKGKQKIEARPSIFWKGENAGDRIAGTFVCWQKTQLNNLAMKLKLADGTHKIVGLTTVLFNLFTNNHNLKAGTPVEIVFEGQVKRAKIYSATVNGKVLESSMSFPEAKPAEVDAYFKAGYEFKGRAKSKRAK